MGLFKKSYKFATLNDKVSNEISKISDKKRLMEIAIEAKDINIADVALDNIKDENYLYEITKSKYFGNVSVIEHALLRIKDEEVINKMMRELPITNRYLKIVYENAKNPPFDISINMSSKIAEENLIKDLDNMKYPIDSEKIKMVAKKLDMADAVKKAIEMLPYDKEKDFLKSLFKETDSITTRLSIINKLQDEDKREMLESILQNGDRTSIIIKTIARGLDKNDPLLDKEVCPKCGAIDSMHLFSEYRKSIDLDVKGYVCNKCKYEILEQTGLGEIKYTKTTLRDFIKK